MIVARRGMGDAPCPSIQQLMGVTDPTDPCQSAAPIPPSSSPMTPPSLANIPSWLKWLAVGVAGFAVLKAVTR